MESSGNNKTIVNSCRDSYKFKIGYSSGRILEGCLELQRGQVTKNKNKLKNIGHECCNKKKEGGGG